MGIFGQGEVNNRNSRGYIEGDREEEKKRKMGLQQRRGITHVIAEQLTNRFTTACLNIGKGERKKSKQRQQEQGERGQGEEREQQSGWVEGER